MTPLYDILTWRLHGGWLVDVDSVALLETFRALKPIRLEDFRARKP